MEIEQTDVVRESIRYSPISNTEFNAERLPIPEDMEVGSRIEFGPLRASKMAHLKVLGMTESRGWTGGKKWNCSKRSGSATRPEKRF